MKSNPSIIEPLEARIAPATFTVVNLNDFGAGSLPDALAKADASPGHDTIIFHLPAAPPHSENVIDLSSAALTSKGNVTITGPGAGRLIIDGHGTKRIFNINDADPGTDSPTVITGISMVRGNDPGLGGGIYSAESLTLKSVVISGCTAQNGGAVVVYDRTGGEGAKAVISNSLITGNVASHSAGGLDLGNLKSISISKTVVSGNAAGTNAGGIFASVTASSTGISITGSVVSGNSAASSGGGVWVLDSNIFLTSKVNITGTRIIGNAAGDKGGGVYLSHGNAFVTGSTVGNNTALNGGGIAAVDFGLLSVSGSAITGNRSTNTTASYLGGGGIFADGGGFGIMIPLKVSNSQISDNRAANEGGGILAYDGIALTVSGSTFARNNAFNDGGGIYADGMLAKRVDVTVTGGLFADNVAQDGGGIDAGGSGAFSISGSKVTGNIVNGDGGGIGTTAKGAVTIKNVVATGNFASVQGGGLFVRDSANFQVSGGSLTGNSARYGGGIYAFDSGGSIKGITITGNAAKDGGGGITNGGAMPGPITLHLTKIFANTAPAGPDIYDPGALVTFI